MTTNPGHETTGDQTAESASPLPATTYEQAQATYRCTSDARERFEDWITATSARVRSPPSRPAAPTTRNSMATLTSTRR